MRRSTLRFDQWRILIASAGAVAFVVLLFVHHAARAPEPGFYIGADVSSLPGIGRAGGRFGHGDAAAGAGARDALAILHDNGRNLFRVRLFVNPQPDFNKSHGATQDLRYALNLAKRIKAAAGGS